VSPTHLLDANVLIALTVAEHEHHERASVWLSSISSFALCPVVEGALVRFLLRVGESGSTAAAVLSGVHASERCQFWPDALTYSDVSLERLEGHGQVTDTYLAALAGHFGGALATFDSALAARHPDTCLLIP